MAVFKCRMCEANLEVNGNTSVIQCEYCGTYQSVITDETGTIRTVLIESSGNIENLLKRGSLALEDMKWDDAAKFFDRVLDINAEEPRAYIGKLLAENHVLTLEDFWQSKSWSSVKSMDNYKKAYRFADDSMKQMLDEHYIKWVYRAACAKAESREISDIQEALRLFTEISGYEDSGERAELCREKIYNDAVRLMGSTYSRRYSTAKSEFESISGYRDADAKAEECAAKAWEEAAEAAEEKRRAMEEEHRKKIQKLEYEERRRQAAITQDIIVKVCVAVVTFITVFTFYYYINGPY